VAPARRGSASRRRGNASKHPQRRKSDTDDRRRSGHDVRPGSGAAQPAGDGPLLSPGAAAAVDTALRSLRNAAPLTDPAVTHNPLEDVVREMLRPMLQAWLDANLPGMVERLVRAEIERVSRGG